MIKKGLMIAFAMSLMFFPGIVKAQAPVSFNIRGGINLSDFNGGLDGTKIVWKQQFGLGVDLALPNNLFIMTGLDYQTKGTKLDYDSHTAKINSTYLQLPLHLAYKINLSEKMRITAEVGPYFAYGIGGKIKAEGIKVNTFGEGRLKKFDFGGGAAIGFEYNHNFLCVGYDCGLRNISDIKGIKIRNSNLFITSGYRF